MLEIKVTVEAPELTAAIDRLADALSSRPVAAPVAVSEPGDILPPAEEKTAQDATQAVTEPKEAVSPAPVQATAPVEAPTSAPAPVQAPAPAPVPEAPKTYTLQEISTAGASLLDEGKMDDLMALLTNYGVPAITLLKPEQYGKFADDLRAMGAKI